MVLNFKQLLEKMSNGDEAVLVNPTDGGYVHSVTIYKDQDGAIRHVGDNTFVKLSPFILEKSQWVLRRYIPMQQAFAAFMAGHVIGVDFVDSTGRPVYLTLDPKKCPMVTVEGLIWAVNSGKWYRKDIS